MRVLWAWIDRNRAVLAERRSGEGHGAVEAVKPVDLVRARLCKRSDQAAQLLDELGERNFVRRRTERAQGGPGRPRILYHIRPKH